jgi:predicted site-specific integrase-resolvase
MEQTPVMDVSPWPQGHGFIGSDTWWNYVLSKEERRRLDQLLGVALLDDEVRERLVERRDRALFERFGLSTETQTWLCSVQAASLTELAEAVVATLDMAPEPA